MNINTRHSSGATILELAGRFDAHEAANLRQTLEEALPATGKAQVAINLTGVNFIDSTGLASLVQGMKRCRERQGDLHLYGLQQPVRIIFELTRLDRAFSIFADEAAALEAFDR